MKYFQSLGFLSNGINAKEFEDSITKDKSFKSHQKRHSKTLDTDKISQPSSPITQALQGALLESNTASDQTKENRRSSKRARNLSRHNNKIKSSSKSKLNVGNHRSNGYAKTNSILNYRTKDNGDRKSKKGRLPSPNQSKTLEKKEREINTNAGNSYIGVTKPTSMFVTSSARNNSVTKSQKWNNKKQYNSFGSSVVMPESSQGKTQMCVR